MNREIKFRAWFDNKMFYEGWNEDFFVTKELIFRYEKDIMQFTGLKDKNGKEIYEGDIMSNGYDTFNIEFFDAKFHATFMPESKEDKVKQGYDYFNTMEVIGNIYENPELLNNAKRELDEVKK